MNLNLSEYSPAYYENNDYYELFSICEDGSKEIEEYLTKEATDKIVLDAGCGTGKFLTSLEKVSLCYTGIDLSSEQINKASLKVKKDTTKLIVSNLNKIDLLDSSYDIVISTWVLGTILDKNERNEVIKELKRVLKPNGKIILIENDSCGEFEILRGHDKDKKTDYYNNYLLNNGFRITKKFDNYFNFKTVYDAKKCFSVIYGEEISNKIKTNIIEHKVIALEYEKSAKLV